MCSMSYSGPRLLRRNLKLRLQAKFPGRRCSSIPGTNVNSSSLGSSSIAKGQMFKLQQSLSIEAKFQFQRDSRGELQLVQSRLSQQRGMLQCRKNRRELRIRLTLVDNRSTIMDRKAPKKGKLQEQFKKITSEKKIERWYWYVESTKG